MRQRRPVPARTMAMMDGGTRLALVCCAAAGVLASSAVVHAEVSGVVRDALTDQPLGGALVSVQAMSWETLTAADGTFTLPDAVGDDLVVVAAHRGYYYGALVRSAPATGLELRLDPVPMIDDPGYVFVEPSACGQCHAKQLEGWIGSPMGQAGQNAWVQDIYDGTGTPGGAGGFVYVRDSIHATDNPTSECAACHEPETWAMQGPSPLGDFANPPLAKQHGVSCDVCHRIADIDVTRSNFPGVYDGVVALRRPDAPDWTVQFGVLGDVDYVSAGAMRASYQPQLRSEVCAACHQDKNDHDDDGDFEDPGGVISEPTYLEWVESDYGDPGSPTFRSCASCHMAQVDRSAACDVLPELMRPPGEVRSHDIRGTTPEFLENAVDLAMTVSTVGDAVDVEVTILNDQAGHHVPTGVTIRNMILLVDAVRDDDGSPLEHVGDQVVHDLGGVGDPAEGYYAGLPGKLYAKINHGEDATGPVFFSEATGIVEDSRIPAQASDTTRYAFTAPDGGGDVRVTARLIYRRSWRALVDAKGWTENGHGLGLEDLSPPHFGHLMESSEELVTVPDPSCPSPPCDAGDGGTGDTAGGSDDTTTGDDGTGSSSGGDAMGDGSGCGCVADPPVVPGWAYGPWLMVTARRRRA